MSIYFYYNYLIFINNYFDYKKKIYIKKMSSHFNFAIAKPQSSSP